MYDRVVPKEYEKKRRLDVDFTLDAAEMTFGRRWNNDLTMALYFRHLWEDNENQAGLRLSKRW